MMDLSMLFVDDVGLGINYFSCVIPNRNLKIDLRIDREMLYYREYEYDTCVSITTYAPS